MAKPEWGQKRACPGCGSRFYDLMHDPIMCPNCGAKVDPSAFSKTRRSRTVPAKPVAAVAAPAEAPKVAPAEAKAETATEPDEAADVVAIADEDDDDKDVIEDASELGEDEDDVSEVVEGKDADDP